MPTPGQRTLFERIQRAYGQCPRWERLTEGQDFDSMRTERAAYFLVRLISGLTEGHVGGCQFHRRVRRFHERYKPLTSEGPGADTPGAPDRRTV